MPRITKHGPKRSIELECLECKDRQQFVCPDNDCYLNGNHVYKNALRRIKRHCLACVPEHSYQGVASCDGKVANPVERECWLYPFRLGRNPNRAGLGNTNFVKEARHTGR
jgi:hypothetical protein